jgi:hypothetical protein
LNCFMLRSTKENLISRNKWQVLIHICILHFTCPTSSIDDSEDVRLEAVVDCYVVRNKL